MNPKGERKIPKGREEILNAFCQYMQKSNFIIAVSSFLGSPLPLLSRAKLTSLLTTILSTIL
jgi:hypothetical protein